MLISPQGTLKTVAFKGTSTTSLTPVNKLDSESSNTLLPRQSGNGRDHLPTSKTFFPKDLTEKDVL